MRTLAAAASALTLLALLAAGQAQAAAPARCQKSNPNNTVPVKGILSQPKQDRFLSPVSFSPMQPSAKSSNPTIDAGAGEACQALRGHGFAVTESTAVNLNRLSPALKKKAMETLFSPAQGNLNYIVLPLTSTDFNVAERGDFSVCDCGDKTPSPTGTCFNPERLKESIEILKEAKAINPTLRLNLKPWTSPAYMKKPGTSNPQNGYRGGEFDGQWSEALGRCLVESVKWVQAQGLKVQSIAAQNEPGLSLPYPSVFMSDADHARVLDTVQKGLQKVSPATQIVIRSDNFIAASGAMETLKLMKNKPDRPVFMAHCYSNDPETPKLMLPSGEDKFCSDRLPHRLEYAMGECSASNEPDYVGDFGWWLYNRVMGDTDFGANTVMGWSGLLDETYGPQNGGCSACRGLISVDFNAKPLAIRENPEFMALTHLSRYTQPDARRILSQASAGAPVNLVFRNPDGSTIVMLRNDSAGAVVTDVYTQDCRRLSIGVPSESVVTVHINK